MEVDSAQEGIYIHSTTDINFVYFTNNWGHKMNASSNLSVFMHDIVNMTKEFLFPKFSLI